MVTEYEQLLQKMLGEKRAVLEELRAKRKPDAKKVEAVLTDISFLQVELKRYGEGLSLFRSKGLPRVGRWGKPKAEGEGEEGTES